MAPHSSTLAWKIPWIEEPGGLQSMGSLRVRHDRVTSLSLFTFMHWRRKWNPLQCSCLENPRDGGAWWAAVYGVAQSRTWLKWLSSSSRSHVTSHVESVELLSLLTIRVWQKDTIWGKWERLVSEYHCFCSKALFLLFQCLLGSMMFFLMKPCIIHVSTMVFSYAHSPSGSPGELETTADWLLPPEFLAQHI